MWISLASGSAQVHKVSHAILTKKKNKNIKTKKNISNAKDKVSLFYSMFGLRSQLP